MEHIDQTCRVNNSLQVSCLNQIKIDKILAVITILPIFIMWTFVNVEGNGKAKIGDEGVIRRAEQYITGFYIAMGN